MAPTLNINDLDTNSLQSFLEEHYNELRATRIRMVGTRTDRSCTLVVNLTAKGELLSTQIFFHQQGKSPQQRRAINLEDAYEQLIRYLNGL